MSELSREEFEKWAYPQLSPPFSNGRYESPNVQSEWEAAKFGYAAASGEALRWIPDQQLKSNLLKVAADVMNGKYLPDVDECRTISDARLEVRRYDSRHTDLAMKLKVIWEKLRNIPAAPDSRPSTEEK